MVATTAAEGVYRALKRDVLTLAMAPGARLTEADLARRWGVSRVPVREACQRLRQEGLIEVSPSRGFAVARLTVKEIADAFDLRVVLESHAAARAAERASEADLARLRRLAATEYRAGDRRSYERFLTRNLEYHCALVETSGNARLARVHRELVEGMHRYFFLGLTLGDFGREMREEHERLNAALRARSARDAVKCVRQQIENSRRRILAGLLSGRPDLPVA